MISQFLISLVELVIGLPDIIFSDTFFVLVPIVLGAGFIWGLVRNLIFGK